MSLNNDIVSRMSLVEEVNNNNNNRRGFDIDLNVALPEQEEENGIIVEEEKSTVIVDSESDEEMKNKRWETLLDVAELKLGDYHYQQKKSQGKTQEKAAVTRKKKLTQGVDEFASGSTRNNTFKECYYNNNNNYYDNNDDCAVVRSTRGRAVALPNKFRDSVLEPVADFPRVTRTGKRKTRLSC